jgi:hypothetical protein
MIVNTGLDPVAHGDIRRMRRRGETERAGSLHGLKGSEPGTFNPTSGRVTRLRLVSAGQLVSNKIACPDRFKSQGQLHENRDRILRSVRL